MSDKECIINEKQVIELINKLIEEVEDEKLARIS